MSRLGKELRGELGHGQSGLCVNKKQSGLCVNPSLAMVLVNSVQCFKNFVEKRSFGLMTAKSSEDAPARSGRMSFH